MIQLRSILKLADNSGAKRLRVMHVHGGSKRRFGYLGDIITASIMAADPHSAVKKGQVVKAVIVRVTKEHGRSDGTYIRFDENAAVVIDNATAKNPLGTRIFGPIAREIKDAGFTKIASLAPEVL